MAERCIQWSYRTMAEAAEKLPDYFRIKHRETSQVESVEICCYSGYVVRRVSGNSVARGEDERSFHILELLQDWQVCQDWEEYQPPTYTRLTHIADDQRANLERLATYLEQLSEGDGGVEFGMQDYVMDSEVDDESAEYLTNCGSGGCAVGHAPYAGITKRPEECWPSYERRAFGYEARDWCFHSSWQNVDNTPQGAAARIRVALSQGIPSDLWGQVRGRIRLSYSPSGDPKRG